MKHILLDPFDKYIKIQSLKKKFINLKLTYAKTTNGAVNSVSYVQKTKSHNPRTVNPTPFG
jgi:hypothetical protein